MKILRTVLQLTAALPLCAASIALGAGSYFEGFEGYVSGSSLHGQSGWAGWDNTAGATGYASTDYAYSGSQSVQIVGASDLTHTWTDFTSGQPVLSVWQYLPNSFTGDSFLILLNTYNHGGPYAWSAQVHANATTGLITSDNGAGATLPMIKGQWVEYRFMIDLAANSVSEYYNNQLLSTHQWYDPGDVNAAARLQGIDLYGNGAANVYYDNLAISNVPEPGSLSLLALGGVVLAVYRRKSARA
jgi:hypothetical protein